MEIKRNQGTITTWEKQFIKLANKIMVEKGMNTNDLARACGSNNYGNFERYFRDSQGQLRSRTIGKVCAVLGIKNK